MSCSSCKREITDDDACVTLRKEDGTYYMFDDYICTQIFQKLNHIKRNVFVREVISLRSIIKFAVLEHLVTLSKVLLVEE